MVQQRVHGREQVVEVEIDRRIGLSGFDPGDVENVADHLEQALAGAAHGPHHVALGALERRAAQQIGHPDDRVQGRPQLVAHGREEPVLGLVGGLGPAERVGQPDQQGRRIGGQEQEAKPEADRERRLAAPVVGQRDHQGEARQAQQGRDHQIAVAIAEPHPEGDPEIERIEHRRGRLTDGQRHRQGQHVEAHADIAPRRSRSRLPQQMAEQEQGTCEVGDPERPATLGQSSPVAVAERRQRKVEQAGRGDRDPDQDLLVLTVGSSLQAADEPPPGRHPAWRALGQGARRGRRPGSPGFRAARTGHGARPGAVRPWRLVGSVDAWVVAPERLGAGRPDRLNAHLGRPAAGGFRPDREGAVMARIEMTGARCPGRAQPEATAGRSRLWNRT